LEPAYNLDRVIPALPTSPPQVFTLVVT